MVLPVYRIRRDESCNILFRKDLQCNSKRRLRMLYFDLKCLRLGTYPVPVRKLKRLGVMLLLVFSLVCVFVAQRLEGRKFFFTQILKRFKQIFADYL